MRNALFDQLAHAGYVNPFAQDFLPDAFKISDEMAADAMPSLSTPANGGIPSYFSNFVDPNLIEVIFAPMQGAKILGEAKKGDWTMSTATFPMAEAVGEVSSYGDFSNDGWVGVNPTFPTRQSYHYQVVTVWGERQLQMAGLAKIQWAAKLNQNSAMVLNRYQNKTYFYGVEGLENWGYLTDPSLPPAQVAGTKAAGGTSWDKATPLEQCADVISMFKQLVTQLMGNIEPDAQMTLALSPSRMACLNMPNEFGLTGIKLIKDQYPGLDIVTAVEYGDLSTGVVQTAQLFAKNVNGQETGTAAFTEKLRAHPIVTEMSSWKQKKSQGTWGAVIFMPAAVSTMTGL